MAIEFSKVMITEIRKKAGLTQRQVAEQMGVTVTTISHWETGLKKPALSPSKMFQLCKILNCSLEQLVESENSDRQVA